MSGHRRVKDIEYDDDEYEEFEEEEQTQRKSSGVKNVQLNH